jgi:hypothetical protein
LGLDCRACGRSIGWGACERKRKPDLPRIIVFDDADPDVFMHEAVAPEHLDDTAVPPSCWRGSPALWLTPAATRPPTPVQPVTPTPASAPPEGG